MASSDTVVSTRPTLESMEGMGGKSVLYDDGKCPSGEIAQFTKRGGRTQINRVCVARPT
ncbi:hypothetical protein GCM10011390_20480 [Aureimonas endophytica]|uniref:Uncharacterized protein n=1 Tax=Aureimonas endophytica TaxID=2027858 RepID=A0A916ZKU8_9HYPH|nr:DUF6719 family protein [Aureimonas endophytica]GGE01493.1 hypothetical protein GCM10011390_20480 [Aureimonas endophytica]